MKRSVAQQIRMWVASESAPEAVPGDGAGAQASKKPIDEVETVVDARFPGRVIVRTLALAETHLLTLHGRHTAASIVASTFDLRAVGRAIYRHLERVAVAKGEPRMPKRMPVRQGDVYLIPVDRIPDDATPVAAVAGRLIVAAGEATNHHHAVLECEAELFAPGQASTLAELYLKVGAGGATITHEEHGAIPLAPGAYEVIRPREYTPQAIRRVAD